MTTDAIVYTKNNCVQCNFTKKEFDKTGLTYEEVNLDRNPEILDQLISEGFMGAPVVKAKNGTTWSGFAPTKIKALAV